MKDSFILRTHELSRESVTPTTKMKYKENILKKVKSHFQLTKTAKQSRAEIIIVSSDDKQEPITKRYPNKGRNRFLLCESNTSQYSDTHLSNSMQTQLQMNKSSACVAKTLQLSKKPRLLLMPTTQERNSITEQKQTEADTSYDKMIPTSSLSNSCNRIEISPDIQLSFSTIRNKKLPNITEDSSNYILAQENKKRISEQISIPQRNKVFKLILRRKPIKKENNNDEEEIDQHISSQDKFDVDNSINSRNKKPFMPFEDQSYSSNSEAKLIKSKTSLSVSQHMFIHCQDKNKRLIIRNLKSFRNSKAKNALLRRTFMRKITQLTPNDIINKIEAKRNIIKQETIQRYCFDIENKVDCCLSKTISYSNDLKSSVLSQEQRVILNKSLIEALKKKNNNKHSILFVCHFKAFNRHNTPVLNYKVSAYEIKILFKLYDNELYNQILQEYEAHTDNKLLTPIKQMLNDDLNRLKTNMHLEKDFNLIVLDNNNSSSLNYSPRKNSKEYYTTIINESNRFFKKNWTGSSFLIFHEKKNKQPKKLDNEDYSLLHDNFYSRADFDVNELQQIAKNLELLPRCKAKNIKFRIVDEQEEIKKNKNMSKESLVFRTQEIKLKIKDSLGTIEEILFFLIKEINFKEFKKLLEQYQMPLESRDKEGNTLLIYAVECSFIECIIYLIHKGSQINAQNNKLNTPLHISLLFKNFEVADLLLKNGADETLLNKDQLTPWQCLSFD